MKNEMVSIAKLVAGIILIVFCVMFAFEHNIIKEKTTNSNNTTVSTTEEKKEETKVDYKIYWNEERQDYIVIYSDGTFFEGNEEECVKNAREKLGW